MNFLQEARTCLPNGSRFMSRCPAPGGASAISRLVMGITGCLLLCSLYSAWTLSGTVLGSEVSTLNKADTGPALKELPVSWAEPRKSVSANFQNVKKVKYGSCDKG